MKQTSSRTAFSLVEVTLALGVTAFCLIAVYGLLPTGMASHRAASSQTTAGQILTAVYADLNQATAGSASTLFGITEGTATTLYFDAFGALTTNSNDRIYRLTISFPDYSPSSRSAIEAHLLLTSPGFAEPAQATGKYQVLAAFDRK